MGISPDFLSFFFFKKMKVNSRKVAVLAAMVFIPTSYDSIIAKMPWQLISISIDNA